MPEKQYLRLIPFIFLSSSLSATDCSPRRKYSLTGTISSKSEIPKFDTDEILDKTVRGSFPITIDLLPPFSHYFAVVLCFVLVPIGERETLAFAAGEKFNAQNRKSSRTRTARKRNNQYDGNRTYLAKFIFVRNMHDA